MTRNTIKWVKLTSYVAPNKKTPKLFFWDKTNIKNKTIIFFMKIIITVKNYDDILCAWIDDFVLLFSSRNKIEGIFSPKPFGVKEVYIKTSVVEN